MSETQELTPALKPIAAVEAASMAWSKFCCALRASATAKVLGGVFSLIEAVNIPMIS